MDYEFSYRFRAKVFDYRLKSVKSPSSLARSDTFMFDYYKLRSKSVSVGEGTVLLVTEFGRPCASCSQVPDLRQRSDLYILMTPSSRPEPGNSRALDHECERALRPSMISMWGPNGPPITQPRGPKGPQLKKLISTLGLSL